MKASQKKTEYEAYSFISLLAIAWCPKLPAATNSW
jgi:hypothetical protein